MNLVNNLPNVGINNISTAFVKVRASRQNGFRLSVEERICAGFFMLSAYFDNNGPWKDLENEWGVCTPTRQTYIRMAEDYFADKGVDIRDTLFKDAQSNAKSIVSLNPALDLAEKLEELLAFKSKVERILNVSLIG